MLSSSPKTFAISFSLLFIDNRFLTAKINPAIPPTQHSAGSTGIAINEAPHIPIIPPNIVPPPDLIMMSLLSKMYFQV